MVLFDFLFYFFLYLTLLCFWNQVLLKLVTSLSNDLRNHLSCNDSSSPWQTLHVCVWLFFLFLYLTFFYLFIWVDVCFILKLEKRGDDWDLCFGIFLWVVIVFISQPIHVCLAEFKNPEFQNFPFHVRNAICPRPFQIPKFLKFGY